MCKIYLAVLMAVTVLACNPPASEPGTTATGDTSRFDLQQARSAIEADNAKFSEDIRKGDSAALGAHYASDAWLMMPNSEPIQGNQITSAWGGMLRMGLKDLRLATTDLVGDEDLLVETGTYEMVGENNASMDKGKYIVVWKNENGSWKIYRDIANTNIPAPPAKK